MIKKEIIFILLFICGISSNSQENSDLEIKLDSIGNKIDETLTNKNKEYVNKIYDINELSKRFIIDSKNKKIKKYNESFINGFSSSFDFGKIILNQIDDGATYDYLNFQKNSDGDYYLLFRLYGNGLNYHKHLIKKINGEYKIIDTYISLTGEFLSDTFSSIYKGLLHKGGLLSNFIKKKKNNSISDLFKIKQMKKLKNEGKYQEAHNLYNTISKEGKKKKLYKITNLMIVAQLNDTIYADAIDDYEKEFPNDVSLYLVSVDGYILSKKYDKAMEAINNLDVAIGGDSFLNFLRGNLYYLKEEFDNSEAKFKEVIEEYPNFLDAYDSLLTIYIETDKTTEAIKILNIMVSDFDLPKDILYNTLKETFPKFYNKEEVVKWSK